MTVPELRRDEQSKVHLRFSKAPLQRFSTPSIIMIAEFSGGSSMWIEDHFGSDSMLQRNERVKLAASFRTNIGAGMVIGGMAAAFFLEKPQGAWTKIGVAIAGLVLGW